MKPLSSHAKRYRLGADIGGTFTDMSLLDEATGLVQIAKVPSTPSTPHLSVVHGIEALIARYGLDPAEIGYFVHGTTIGLNSIIERKGAATGLLVTRGFGDLLDLGRSRLPNVYDLLVEKPEPLIDRSRVREIDERMLAGGRVQKAIDVEEVVKAAGELVAEGVEAIAVSFLHSYANPAHETAARDAIAEAFPGLFVCTSSGTWPQIREYERSMISVANAFLGRRMSNYYSNLIEDIEKLGVPAHALSTKSNGGIMTVASARSIPVETLSSGPAAGVIGAQFVGACIGERKLICLDMGGTSTEVAVINESILYANESRIGDFELVLPSVDVNSIGAGGGSIAWIDSAGILKVGPESAGSQPGPACYGRGGEDATITDAYVATGIVDPDAFLDGELKLDPALAHQALAPIGAALGLDVQAASEAILRVATSNMYSQLVPLMARKGVDLSEYALLCYGGAGPTHGALLAKEVGITRVIVPVAPGALCALGSLVADAKSDFIATLNRPLDAESAGATLQAAERGIEALEERARGWIKGERIAVESEGTVRSLDMRYHGQSFDVTVDVSHVDLAAPDAFAQVVEAFEAFYRSVYGHLDPSATIEIVNLRVTAVGTTRKPRLAELADGGGDGDGEPEPRTRRTVFLEGRSQEAAVYTRSALRRGDVFCGPAIVEQYDTTVLFPSGFRCRVDSYGNIIGEAV